MRVLVLLLFAIVSFNCLGQLVGKVVSISDGDTFWILTSENERIKVRLHGIDCPESNQAFGTVAKKFLSDLIYNKEVELKQMDVDRYERRIVMATIGEVNVNESLLKAGLAWHYKQYDKNAKWAAMEDAARKEKLGLWVDPNPTAPWDFRRSERENK